MTGQALSGFYVEGATAWEGNVFRQKGRRREVVTIHDMADRPKAAVLGAGELGMAFCALLATRFAPIELWEPDPDTGRAARKTGHAGRVSADLAGTVSDATVVIVTTEASDRPRILTDMARHLTSGAVVIIAGTGHERALEDAVRTLPSHASVICATPIAWTRPRAPKGSELVSRPSGVGASSAKGSSSVRPFADAVAGISPSPSAHPDAVGVVQAILEAGGATAFFTDPREFDALAVAATVLPTLIAATLVRVVLGETPTASTPNDFDRAGGIAFAEMTRSLEDPSQAIEGDVTVISDHAIRWIDQIIADLHTTRQKILDGDTFPIGIDTTAKRRQQWITTRKSSPELAILPDLPTPSRRRLFF